MRLVYGQQGHIFGRTLAKRQHHTPLVPSPLFQPDELVEKRNEEQKEEICDGTLVKKKRLETKDYKPFVYPNKDTPENEEELMEEDWDDTDGNGDENIGE